MDDQATARVIGIAEEHGLKTEQRPSRKLIGFTVSGISEAIYIHRDVGTANGRQAYFRVMVAPHRFQDPTSWGIEGLSVAVNRRRRDHYFLHSGYRGFPYIDQGNEPSAKGYRAESFEALSALFEHLIAAWRDGASHATHHVTEKHETITIARNSGHETAEKPNINTHSAIPAFPRSNPAACVARRDVPKRGLIIDRPWIDLILDGFKIWEMRPAKTKVRGAIALIAKGTGTIVGEAVLVDSTDALDPVTLAAHRSEHAITTDCLADREWMNRWTCAWKLADIIRYTPPITYRHPSGAVTWVTLSPDRIVFVN